MKGDLKAVGIVVLGVLVAGYVFRNFSDIEIVNESRKGFSGLL
jgi:hypothetical protein